MLLDIYFAKGSQISKKEMKMFIEMSAAVVGKYTKPSCLHFISKRKSLLSKKSFYVVAKINKTTVGFLMYRIEGKHTVYVYELHVVEEFQRKGYGTQILQFFFLDIPKETKNIVLFVHQKNKDAIRLYKSRGFFIECKEMYTDKYKMVFYPQETSE